MKTLIQKCAMWVFVKTGGVVPIPITPVITPAPDVSPALTELLSEVKNIFDNENDPVTEHRFAIINVVFTKIIELSNQDPSKNLDMDGKLRFDRKEAKKWATACAQVIGMLAGLVVKPGATNAAIDEMMRDAKKLAASIGNEKRRVGAGDLGRSSAESKSSASVEINTDKIKKDADFKARQQYIEILETQAEAEVNPEAQRAMRQLAENMKRELELDKVA